MNVLDINLSKAEDYLKNNKLDLHISKNIYSVVSMIDSFSFYVKADYVRNLELSDVRDIQYSEYFKIYCEEDGLDKHILQNFKDYIKNTVVKNNVDDITETENLFIFNDKYYIEKQYIYSLGVLLDGFIIKSLEIRYYKTGDGLYNYFLSDNRNSFIIKIKEL